MDENVSRSGFQGKVPIALSLVSAVVLAGLAAWRLRGAEGALRLAGAALILVYFLWLFVESRVAVGEVSKAATREDRGTLELYAFGRFAVVVSALALEPSWTSESPGQLACGLAVFAGGVAFRLVAIRTLGRFYSHRVRIAADHEVVDTGPYRIVRHPAYTGMLLAHLGFVVVLFNPVALGLLCAVLLPSIVLRIRVEERALEGLAGYARYSAGRKRLLPLVW